MKFPSCRHLTSVFRTGVFRCMHSEKSVAENQKSLKQLIVQKIKATGPITVAQFMKEVLVNPAYGYYTTKDVFGKSGDFVTSPEINQIFGELIAVWFVNEWMKVGAPQPFNLLEFGPGRGSLMSDVLRTFHRLKVDNDLKVHMIEVSEVLAKIQAENLCASFEDHEPGSLCYRSGKTSTGVPIYWYKNFLESRNPGFTLYLAHEFFDALPIHKFQKTENGWSEVLIDLDRGDESGEKLRYVLSPGPTPMSKTFVSETETRDHFEVCPDGLAIMEILADRMERYGGIMLIFDYGHNGTKTDTFRAFRKHTQCDPLTNVGDADLTADVDFAALKKISQNKLISFGPVTQRQFLKQMKMDVRLEMLLKNANDEQKELLVSGCRMMTDEEQMGNSFHVVSFFPEVLTSFLKRNPPIGFIENES